MIYLTSLIDLNPIQFTSFLNSIHLIPAVFLING
jgi:hypothetical protein